MSLLYSSLQIRPDVFDWRQIRRVRREVEEIDTT
jgi:hypothetical protein